MADIDSNIPQSVSKNKTYVKIFRGLHDGFLKGDGPCQAVLLYLLLSAQRFDNQSGDKFYKAGNVYKSITEIKINTGFSRKVIFRCINKLEKAGTISTLRSCRGVYITICNYLQYQVDEKHDGHGKGAAEGVTEGTTEGVHIKKEKKGKKEKKEIPAKLSALSRLTPSQGDLLKRWLKFAQENSKTKLTPSEEAYAKAILDLERQCGLGCEKLESVLSFVETDTFWKPNALSLPGLLKKSTNGLRKIENVLQAMEKAINAPQGYEPEEVRRKRVEEELKAWATETYGEGA